LNHLKGFSAGFLTFQGEKAKKRAEMTPSVKAYGFATFPKGTAFAAGKFAAMR
jgi:hypothetical protein